MEISIEEAMIIREWANTYFWEYPREDKVGHRELHERLKEYAPYR